MTARKGDARKADDMFRLLIQARGHCERCGTTSGPFEAAHIVRRARSAIRCAETNAWCLCVKCHDIVDDWPDELMALVERTIGIETYRANKAAAEEWTSGIKPSSARFWREEAARLKAECERLGIDPRWTVSDLYANWTGWAA